MSAALVLSTLALGAVVPSCVRMTDPGKFRCDRDSDCATGQKCFRTLYQYPPSPHGDCRDANYCISDTDCLNGMVCHTGECIKPECTEYSSSVCGGFACDVYNYTCVTTCFGSSSDGCASGFVCKDGACVQVTPKPPPVLHQNGTACSANADCQSSHCCGPSGAKVCSAQCLPDGMECTDAGDCAGGYCCPAAELAGKYCYSGACTLGKPSQPCVQDAYCETGHCTGGMCAAPSGSQGTSCSADSDCTSGKCCATTETTKVCQPKCPLRSGDYCLESDTCPNGYCDGASNFPTDGFCSAGCLGSCGVNSLGVRNVCVTLTSGSSPSAACKPGCNTNADCTRIHPDLRCWDGGTFKACDFDTFTWGP